MKVCSTPGCPELTDSGKCDQHRAESRRRSERRRPSARQRGYDSRWERTRRRFLAAHPFCQCGARATEAHHRDGLGPKGPRGYDWSNLEALCHDCHSKRTARDQPGGWNT